MDRGLWMPLCGRAARWVYCLCLGLVILGGCGGGSSGSGSGEDQSVASVQIDQTALLLTAVDESRQLSARAMDARGNVLDVPITWTSTTQADISIDSDGKITARKANGASQIVAQAEGIDSAPLLVAATTLPAGAITLTDAHIVGGPVETDPSAAPSFSNTYKIVLQGVTAPAIGSLIVNTESKPVVGRVVAVDTNGNLVTVTLALVSLREAFPNLYINETIDLSRAEIMINPDIATMYSVSRTGNKFTFTPKTAAAPAGAVGAVGAVQALNIQPSAVGVPVGTSIGPPFTSCEFSPSSLQSAIPMQLSVPPLFDFTISPSLDILYTPAGGLERFVINADPVIVIDGGVNITASFEGKISCTVELWTFNIPVGGALSVFVSGLVPVGLGLEAGGKITVATMKLAGNIEAKAQPEVGVNCPLGGTCQFVGNLGNTQLQLKPSIDAPGVGDVRLEPFLTLFGYMQAQVGNPLLQSLKFDAFNAQVGGKLHGSFALPLSQISDTTYQSDYKASLTGKAGWGSDLLGFLALVGLSNMTGVEFEKSVDLAQSPTGLVTADKASFVTGETVHFHVALDAATLEFLGIDNVKEIRLIRQSAGNTELIDSISASPGQTSFNFSFTSSGPGSVGEFSAFVITTLLPFDIFELEVGQATEAATGVILQSRTGGVSSSCRAGVLVDDGGANEIFLDDDDAPPSQYQPAVPDAATTSLASGAACAANLTEGASAEASLSASLSVAESFGASSVVGSTGITEFTGLSASASATGTVSANVSGAIAPRGEKRADSSASNGSFIQYFLHVPAGVSATVTTNLQADPLASAQAEVWSILDGATDWLPGSGYIRLCPSSAFVIDCLDQASAQSVFGPFPGPATIRLQTGASAGTQRYILKKSQQDLTGGYVVTTLGENGSWSGSASASITVSFSPTP